MVCDTGCGRDAIKRVPPCDTSSRDRSSWAKKLVERDEHAGHAHVAIVLILEDQVVTKRVPSQLAGNRVILMKIGPLVDEDCVKREPALSFSKNP